MYALPVPPVVNVVNEGNEGNEEGESCRISLFYNAVMEFASIVLWRGKPCEVCSESHDISKLENTLRDPLYAVTNFLQIGLVKQLERNSKGDYLHYDKGTKFVNV